MSEHNPESNPFIGSIDEIEGGAANSATYWLDAAVRHCAKENYGSRSIAATVLASAIAYHAERHVDAVTRIEEALGDLTTAIRETSAQEKIEEVASGLRLLAAVARDALNMATAAGYFDKQQQGKAVCS